MDILGIINLPNWFIYLAIIAVLLYIHFNINYTFWKKQNVPGPTAWPIFGNLSAFATLNHVFDDDFKNFQKYGPIYGNYEGSAKTIMVNDPELLKQMLVKDSEFFRNRNRLEIEEEIFLNGIFFLEDDEWKKTRKLLSPMFSAGKLKRMSVLMNQCSEDLIDCVTEASEKNNCVDMLKFCRTYALNVLGKCIFGINIDVKDPNNQFLKCTSKMFESLSSPKLILLVLFPKLSHFFGLAILSNEVKDYFLNVVKTVFEARKNSKEDKGDFVQLILEKQAQMEGEESDENLAKIFSYNNICANSVSLIIAGIDSIITTMSYAIHSLAVLPEYQEKLIDEIDATVEKFGDIDYEALHEMPYLSAVIDETLRLYPPAVRGDRICGADYKINDLFLPKGTVLTYSQYTMQRNPAFWKDPDTFDPSRFLNDPINAFHYFPFLQGPRNCIAKRFALIEIKLGLCKLLRKMRFKTCPKTEIPLKWDSRKDMMSTENINLAVELR